MNKKKILLALFLLLTLALLSSCQTKQEQELAETKPSSNSKIEANLEEKVEKLEVYVSFFPVHDFVSRIAGDRLEIKSIIDWEKPPHGYEPSASQLARIAQADLIIYNGANMESFISDLKDVVKDESRFLDLSQGLELLSHDLEASNNLDQVNPHTWLSLQNAQIQLDTIAVKLGSIDPQSSDYYQENLKKAQAEFKALDTDFATRLKALDDGKEKYFIVSHAAFNYLAKDHNLKQVAITGVSPEDEPSAKSLKEIADFVQKHGIGTIFFEGKATPKVADTLARETKTKTSILYTMEALSKAEAELGYLELMKINLNNLIKSFAD